MFQNVPLNQFWVFRKILNLIYDIQLTSFFSGLCIGEQRRAATLHGMISVVEVSLITWFRSASVISSGIGRVRRLTLKYTKLKYHAPQNLINYLDLKMIKSLNFISFFQAKTLL